MKHVFWKSYNGFIYKSIYICKMIKFTVAVKKNNLFIIFLTFKYCKYYVMF